MFTSDLENCFVDIDVFSINTELEVRCLWVVKLLFQRLSHSQEIIMFWRGEKNGTHTDPTTLELWQQKDNNYSNETNPTSKKVGSCVENTERFSDPLNPIFGIQRQDKDSMSHVETETFITFDKYMLIFSLRPALHF